MLDQDVREELRERFKNFLEDRCEDSVQEFAEEHPEKLRFVFDWDRLEHYDKELASAYKSNPTSVQKSFDRALRYSDAHDAICLTNAWVVPGSVPDETLLHRRDTNQIGRLVSVPVRTSNIKESGQSLRAGGFRCEACGNLAMQYSRYQVAQEPFNCSDCGRKRVEFYLDEEMSLFVEYKEAQVKDAAHLLFDFEEPVSMHAEFYGPAATKIEDGDWVQAIGILSANVEESRFIDEYLRVFEAILQDPEEIESRIEVADDRLVSPSGTSSHLKAYASDGSNLSRELLLGYTTQVESLFEDYEATSSMTEEDVKMKVINPLIELLGWDVYSGDVRMEYPVEKYESNKAVDYALLYDGDPEVCIEAKKPSTAIARKALDQLYEYMKELDSEWGILTDGWEYKMIRSGTSGMPNQLADFTIDIAYNHKDLLENYTYNSIKSEVVESS